MWQWRHIKLVIDESGHDIHPSQKVLRNSILQHLGSKVTKVSPSLVHQLIPATDLVLVSGTLSFLRNLLPSFNSFLSTTSVIAVDSSPVCRRYDVPYAPNYSWQVWNHKHVGGVTRTRILMGFGGSTSEPPTYRLHRRVKDIISYGLPVQPTSPEPKFTHYRPLDLISISDLERPIVSASHRSTTNWGFRRLSGKEICNAFNFPTWLIDDLGSTVENLQVFQNLVPLGLLTFTLDLVLPSVQEDQSLLGLQGVPSSLCVWSPFFDFTQ